MVNRVWSWSLVLLLNSCWFIVMLKFFVIGRCAYLDFSCTDLARCAISQLQTIFSLAEVVLLRKFPMYEYRWLIRIGMAKKLVLVYIVDSIFLSRFLSKLREFIHIPLFCWLVSCSLNANQPVWTPSLYLTIAFKLLIVLISRTYFRFSFQGLWYIF